jgi:hypothetical protein
LFEPHISCELFAIGEIPSDKEIREISKKHGNNVGSRTLVDGATLQYITNAFKLAKKLYEDKMKTALMEAME